MGGEPHGVAASIGHALGMALLMGWQMLWPLILGFAISGAIQAVVSKKEMSRLLPDDSPKALTTALGLGAASSSCSYAAVALARSLFRKGASFTAAMAFEMASTNLVLELGIVLVALMGWTFAGAEFLGAPIMVGLLALLFRAFLSKRMVEEAREHADRGVPGRMEGHASMDMSVTKGSILHRLFSTKGLTATSHYFVMDWVSIAPDIAIGLVLSGAVATFVPNETWSALFFTGHPVAARFVGPVVGPLVAVVTFVCSVGNVPLAAVLWNKGISFGGVIAFLFADLIVLPILNIYRKYYGLKMSAFLFAAFYASMAGAALVVELLFELVGIAPHARAARVEAMRFEWNYTTFLNLGFLLLAAVLVVRFFRTGGPEMLKHMSGPPSDEHRGHRAAHAH